MTNIFLKAIMFSLPNLGLKYLDTNFSFDPTTKQTKNELVTKCLPLNEL